MKISDTMIVMFLGSFIIQYFLMPPIMVNSRNDITNNIGKAYMSAIMGLFMVLLEVMMHDHQYHVLSLHLYGILIAGLVLFIYLYRKQVAIKDKQYLEGMIEHHSMGILTSEEILKKTDNYDVAKLAKNIIQTQKDEIRIMKTIIDHYKS
jgi:Ca2+/Na+ antiporter